jgi:hypothetical protein
MDGWISSPMKLSEKNGEEWNPSRFLSISAHSNNTHYFG